MSMTRVTDRATGIKVVCAWDDCERLAWDEMKVRVTDPGARQSVDYIFCSERHRDYWRWSHRSNGNLPPGSKLSVL